MPKLGVIGLEFQLLHMVTIFGNSNERNINTPVLLALKYFQ